MAKTLFPSAERHVFIFMSRHSRSVRPKQEEATPFLNALPLQASSVVQQTGIGNNPLPICRSKLYG